MKDVLATGTAFVGLLEFSRRQVKEWMLLTLPLKVAEHASDDQLATFIETLLTSLGDKSKN